MRDVRNEFIAKNVKAERNRKGLTQFELAEIVGASPGSISLIERGIQTPSVLLALDIAKALEIDITELFKGILKV